jgi:hypothetical protein
MLTATFFMARLGGRSSGGDAKPAKKFARRLRCGQIGRLEFPKKIRP